jgi:hypothetical protein
LHYTDIAEIALESGYLVSRGRTPHNAMRARLSVDVRDNPESPFVQTAPAYTASKVPLPDGPLEPGRRCCILVARVQFVRDK